MNPKDLDLVNYISPIISSVSIIDKETQTSKEDLMPCKPQQSTPTPSKTCKDDDVKIFEFCEVIRDPNDDTVSLVKETFTEEVIKTNDGIYCDKPTHTRYKYCKEVVQPYCKTFQDKCPKFPKGASLDKLKKTSNMSDDSKTTFVNPHKTGSQTSKGEKKRPCPPTRSDKKECQEFAANCEEKPKCPKLDDSKFKEYLSSCINTTIQLAKKGSEACIDKCEKVIGIKKPTCGEEKPSYYVMKKPIKKESSTDCTEKSSIQSILESETVKSIQSAVQDLICTVYTKTKKAVELIKSESCRHIGLDEKTPSKSKAGESRSLDKIVNFIPERFKAVEQNRKNEGGITDSISLEKVMVPALDAIKKVASVVSSTASAINDIPFSEIRDEYINKKFDKSSPEDNPDLLKNPPKKISHEHEPSPNPSVFAMIKTKFFSMFADKKECDEEEASSSSSSEDEHTAESTFDKYCEQ